MGGTRLAAHAGRLLLSVSEDDNYGPRAYENRHETNLLLEEAPAKRPKDVEKGISQILQRAQFLGYNPKCSHKILDFGCGIGHSVGCLVDAHGLDAYGVDVYEFWGSERQHYYEKSDTPVPEIAQRLFKLHPPEYKIPFPDGHFDFIFSDQVFEHIVDRKPALLELKRVLKPDGLSLHIFPGPGKLREPHIGLPFIPLCHSKSYLALWALLGYRTDRQRQLSWRKTLRANLDTMRYCHYPDQSMLKEEAAEAGVKISFQQEDWLKHAGGRPAQIIRAAQRIGLGGLTTRLLGGMAQRMMIISG